MAHEPKKGANFRGISGKAAWPTLLLSLCRSLVLFSESASSPPSAAGGSGHVTHDTRARTSKPTATIERRTAAVAAAAADLVSAARLLCRGELATKLWPAGNGGSCGAVFFVLFLCAVALCRSRCAVVAAVLVLVRRRCRVVGFAFFSRARLAHLRRRAKSCAEAREPSRVVELF
jgi:hypothetical protein